MSLKFPFIAEDEIVVPGVNVLTIENTPFPLNGTVGASLSMMKVVQATTFFAVIASDIHYGWSINPYATGILALCATLLVTGAIVEIADRRSGRGPRPPVTLSKEHRNSPPSLRCIPEARERSEKFDDPSRSGHD